MAGMLFLLAVVAAVVLVVHIGSWFLDPHGLSRVPGPPLAQFSTAWMGWVGHTGRINTILHNAHLKYGKLSTSTTLHPL